MNSKKIITGMLLIGVSVFSNAQNQAQRIKQGVKSGEITKSERVQIAKQRQDVKQATAVAKADGIVTKDEKKIIIAEKKQASKTIYKKKHNSKDRN